MKIRSFSFAAFNRFDSQFKDLNCNEMNALRGGTEPPIPSSGGEDYIIDIMSPKKVNSVLTISTFTTTVDFDPYKKPKKK